jgi:hypothetical protein
MSETAQMPRLALLGAGPAEIELLADLQAGQRVQIVAVFDADPAAPGLGIAQVLGLPAGADAATRDRARDADFVVLPSDREARRAVVDWASALRTDLLSVAEARRRFGGAGPAPPGLSEAGRGEALLGDLLEASARLQAKSQLADWLLGLAMRAVNATGGSIQLLAPDTAELYLVAARGLSERLVRLGRHRVGAPVSGMVAATRTPQVLHGPRASGPLPRARGAVAAALRVPRGDRARRAGGGHVS